MSLKERAHDKETADSKRRPPLSTRENQRLPNRRRADPATTCQLAKVRPGALSSRGVLQLQRTVGNRAVAQLLAGTARSRPSRQESNTGLPDNLKAGVEHLSGISLDDVRVHYNSARPARLQALAYTQGADIHLGPGQEKHLAHEAWHVVQQKQGRVRPTKQEEGAVLNDDRGLEAEADSMGERALGSMTPDAIAPARVQPEGGGPESDPLSASHAEASHTSQAPIQRRAGFEIEMLVAADIDGKDAPEKVVHYQDGGLKLTIDHGGEPILKMTRAIKSRAESKFGVGKSPTDAYHSILEIVTPAGEVQTEKDRRHTLQYIKRATELALKIFGGTNSLRERVSLSSIVDTGSPLFVGADVARYKVGQAQTLDAHIQASVGIDLARIPAFFERIQKLKRSRLVKGGIEEDIPIDYAAGLDEAISVSQKITEEIRAAIEAAGEGGKLKAGQNLANMQGLLATVALYLAMGRQYFFGTGSNWKNFTSLLARVDLSQVFKTSLTPTEREIFQDEDNLGHIKERLLDETHRLENDNLLMGTSAIYNHPVVECGAFIDNVFTADSDGFTELLRAAENFTVLPTESVGPLRVQEDLPVAAGGQAPADMRRQGAIFEMRVLKYRDDLELKVDELGKGTRYPLNSWYAVCKEIVDEVHALNQIAFGIEEESESEIAHRQEYEEYMSLRREQMGEEI